MHLNRLAVVAAVVLAALAIVVPAAGAAPAASKATVTITVKMSEFRFALSKRTVRPGTTVAFVVRNVGVEPHDFAISGPGVSKKTRILRRGQKVTLRITFKRKGRYSFVCTVGRHAAEGMTGFFFVR